MSNADKTQPLKLPPELGQRVHALARAAAAEPAAVLARLVEFALGEGAGLATGADLPREIVLAKPPILAHAAAGAHVSQARR